MLRLVTQTPCGSHVPLARAAALATVPPSVCHSTALAQPAQGVQEGHAEVLKKKKNPLVKITRESPHTKAGNSSENTSHAGSEGPAWLGGASPC